MSADVIAFLLSQPPIKAWIENKWLRPHKTYADYLVLTKPGIDECLSRVIDFKNNGSSARSHRLRVSKDRVEAFRYRILNGSSDVSMIQSDECFEMKFKDF
jgi:hypothetical protein